MEFLRQNRTLGRASALVGTLGLLAALSGCGYDNDVDPSAGIVTAHADPYEECHFVGKVYSCNWHYPIFIDGCVELSPETIAQAREQDDDWEPSRGWVDVTPETWEQNPDGTELVLSERGFISSIEPFGIDNDNAENCPVLR